MESDILIAVLFILLNTFFTISEAILDKFNEARIKAMTREDSKNTAMLIRLAEKPGRLIGSIHAGANLSGFLAAVLLALLCTTRVASALGNIRISLRALYWLSLFLVAAVFSLLNLAFGTFINKWISQRDCDKFAVALAPVFSFFEFAGRPFVFLSSALANAVLRLTGINPDSGPDEFSEEEIRMMVDAGGERGSIEEREKEMINNIFEFDDRTVEEMMTHRTEIVFLRLDSSLPEIVKAALDSGYSRIPVCEDDLDSIAGILYAKDLLPLLSSGADDVEFSLSDYMREPLYVLESNTCMAVLSEFKTKKLHIAIVVDEYGGTSGLVTMEDLLESIVGNIQDEYDEEEEDEIFVLGENRYLVDGLTSLEDVDKYFGFNLAEEEEFETIGGYVISLLGRIPADGEHPCVEICGYRFIVSEMDERRVAKLEAERIETEKSPPAGGLEDKDIP